MRQEIEKVQCHRWIIQGKGNELMMIIKSNKGHLKYAKCKKKEGI